MKSLLIVNPMKRLGYKGGGAEVKAHPFFAKIGWSDLPKKTKLAPFRLNIEKNPFKYFVPYIISNKNVYIYLYNNRILSKKH
jgi:hypothetical protein